MLERFIGSERSRKLRRAVRNSKVTILCLVLTVIVLRGTIGAGRFGTPEQDLLQIRHRLLQIHPNPNPNPNPNLKPKVLLVTASSSNPCENPLGDHYLLKSLRNKIDYCRIHGIEIFYASAVFDAEMSGFWSKLPILRELLVARPEVEFLWWIDSDAVFTDMAFEVPWERYEGFNLVMHGWSDLVYQRKNWVGLNTGSFLIRNCQWSLDMIEAWAPMGRTQARVKAGKLLTRELENRPDFEADDQSALVYLLAKERERWGPKVYLESEYYLHGFWGDLVDRLEEKEKEKVGNETGRAKWPPLVTHFVGCKPCGRGGEYPPERCFKGMDRAFNFGDNQVLQLLGFRHVSLESDNVERLH